MSDAKWIETARWWVWRDERWTEIEAGELPRDGETAYILRENEDPEDVLRRPK